MGEAIERKLEEARAARAAGDTAGALGLYEEVAAIGDAAQRIHALRHVSDLAREQGAIDRAIEAGLAAVGLYEEPSLERANALRVAALALDAAGRSDDALPYWHEARHLYEAAGVAAGVGECTARLGG